MTYLKNSVSLAYSPDACKGCKRCTEVCARGVFIMKGHKAAVTDRDKCIECGACMNNCAYGAITVNPGVGCANAMIIGLLRYGDMEKGGCGCDSGSENRSCC